MSSRRLYREAPRLRRRLPVMLLVLVASVQIVLAFHGDLTPWKGGGFGMFATVDGPLVRHVELVAIGPGFQRSVDLSNVPGNQRRRAANYPTLKHLQDLAKHSRSAWPEGTREVRVSVWSADGGPHLPRLRRVLVTERRFQVKGPASEAGSS